MKKLSIICAVMAAVTIGSVPAAAYAPETGSVEKPAAVYVDTSASLSANRISLNGTVRITASKAADSVYAFYYRLSGESSWRSIRNYSENTVADLKASAVGKYEVLVKTKNSSGKIVKEYLSFTAVDDLSVNGTISSGKVSLGTGVTVSAKASGGNGGYTYSVFKRKSGASSWTNVLKDSSSCNVIINPASAGDYEICIKVKDKTGVLRKKYCQFNVADFSADIRLERDQVSLGQTQKITALVSDDTVKCSYKFYYMNPKDTDWKSIKNEAGSNTVSFKPAVTGTYKVCVKAINTAGNTRKAYSEFRVTKGLAVYHTLSEKNLFSGDSLTVVPSSTGGTGNVKYSVYYTTKEQFDSGSPQWITALKYGQTGNAVITPDKTGEYVVVTKAKDENGTIRKTEYTYFNVFERLTLSAVFMNNRTTMNYKTGFTVTADAKGGAGQYTYSLKIREKGTSDWTLINDFVTDPQQGRQYFRIYRSVHGRLQRQV